MKKALKVGLAVLAASAMTSSVVYADMKGEATGRVRAYVSQNSVTDQDATTGDDESYSYQDMASDARWGYTLSKKTGAWTASAKIELGIDSAEAITTRDHWVKIENDSMAYTMGRSYPSGTTVGGKYLGAFDNTMYVGETIGRDDWLAVNLKDVGLTAVVGANKQNSGTVDYKEQVLAGFYSTSMDALTVKGSYTSVSWTADKNMTASAVGTLYDGGGKTALAVGVGFAMGDMSLNANLDSLTTKSGVTGTDDVKKQTTVLILDKDLGENAGVSVFYSASSEVLTSANTEKVSDLTVNYQMQVAGLPLNLTYSSKTTKNDLTAATTKVDESNTLLGASFVYGF